jgi:hypothetical protein
MGAETHQEAARQFNMPGPCRIVKGEWPYDCEAKDKHPDHTVYVCETHNTWWHEYVHAEDCQVYQCEPPWRCTCQQRVL